MSEPYTDNTGTNAHIIRAQDLAHADGVTGAAGRPGDPARTRPKAGPRPALQLRHHRGHPKGAHYHIGEHSPRQAPPCTLRLLPGRPRRPPATEGALATAESSRERY
ncbi:hypothetical protein E2C01_048861 [Portunus trituberculatus]|uniref:Uncharacterized protein n=1 Tax=Portunus trituberculatus TaxID=210409 RepID=A0A5B7G7I8_PORTR|nr:hypothetical protein [Portunus trituberculatus]